MSNRADWQDRADDGEGHFAIALALLDVAYQIKCLGNGDAATPMGAIEAFGSHIGEKLDALTDAIRSITTE